MGGCWAGSRKEAPAASPANTPLAPHDAPTHPLLHQFTEAKILAEFIKTDAHRLAVQARPPMAVTNAVSWRQEGLFYKKNEVFLDVVESVNLLVNSNGTVVRSEVVGALKMRAYLSGMVSTARGQHGRVGAFWGGETSAAACLRQGGHLLTADRTSPPT